MKKEEIKGLKVEECSWYSVKEIFLRNHYLKSMPAGILVKKFHYNTSRYIVL
jgi:hypothetical protein